MTKSQTVGAGKWRPAVQSQPYPGSTYLCPGGPVLSPQLVGIIMEDSNKVNNATPEYDTFKKSEVATSDDQKSVGIVLKAHIYCS